MVPSHEVWIRRIVESERACRAEETRRLKDAGLGRPGRPLRRALTRPRNRPRNRGA